jgi:hypothetical protein
VAEFPKLKTGVVAQHPSIRALEYRTSVFRFIDSAEQRYREHSARRRRWVIDLSLLDDTELATLFAFFEDVQRGSGLFDFEDPWTGSLVLGCRFENDALTATTQGEFSSDASVAIVESLL